MREPKEPGLTTTELSALRGALRAEFDWKPEPTRRRFRPARVALIIGVFSLFAFAPRHETHPRLLSSESGTVVSASRGVSPPVDKSKERSHMTEIDARKRRRGIAIALTASAALSAPASAQNSGYAHFGSDSDTIRINGNTSFTGVDATYEMRIRIAPGAPVRNVLAEQRDSTEDKGLVIGSTELRKATIRGWNCGDINAAPMSSDFAGNWRHIAWVREGEESRLYIDGILHTTWPGQSSCVADIPDSTMSIGMARYNVTCCPSPAFPSFLGDLDWIHVRSGAHYSANFTPPRECEIQADATSQLLLRFNEPAGTVTMIDESPNRFVCELGVAVYPGVVATMPSLRLDESGYPACGPECAADVDGNRVADAIDLAVVLARWGTAPKDYPRADANLDGLVDATDLAIVLSGWGPCQ